ACFSCTLPAGNLAEEPAAVSTGISWRAATSEFLFFWPAVLIPKMSAKRSAVCGRPGWIFRLESKSDRASRTLRSSRVSSKPSGRPMRSRADRRGYFGPYGGRFAPETLMAPLEELERAFARFRHDRRFPDAFSHLL